MTQLTHFQEPGPATGSDSGGGSRSRSRIPAGRARRLFRLRQGWCPRLTSTAVEAGERPSVRSRPARTGSDSGGGSRSRIHVGRARRRSRLRQGWCPRLTSTAVEAGEKPSDRSCPARTGLDSGGGSRSRVQAGRARRRSRLRQGWCPRLTSTAVEAGEKPSGRSRERASWTGVPCTGTRWRPEALDRSDLSGMMTPTAAQADHY